MPEAIINGRTVKFRQRKTALPEPRAIKTVHDKGTVQCRASRCWPR
jgi:hypothetical protein